MEISLMEIYSHHNTNVIVLTIGVVELNFEPFGNIPVAFLMAIYWINSFDPVKMKIIIH